MKLTQGTTIIAVILHGTIFIGSDSRIHDMSGRPQGTSCKIVQVESAVGAVAGLLGDPDAKWRTVDLARAALTSRGSLDERVAGFVARVRSAAKPLLKRIRTENSDLYRQAVVNKPFIQAVLADRGELRQVTLEPRSTTGGRVSLVVHIESCDSPCDQTYVALGHFDNLTPIV